jgi:tetratricopeptide (TPR) repeat protein
MPSFIHTRAKLPLAMLALALLLTACGGAEDRKSVYMERGLALMEEGNHEKARLEFKNVLQIDPKDADARFQLGLANEKLNEWRAAFQNYQAVLQLDETRHDARVKVAQILLLGGEIEKALAEVETVLAALPDDVDALAVRAGLRARQGDVAGARGGCRTGPGTGPGASQLRCAAGVPAGGRQRRRGCAGAAARGHQRQPGQHQPQAHPGADQRAGRGHGGGRGHAAGNHRRRAGQNLAPGAPGAVPGQQRGLRQVRSRAAQGGDRTSPRKPARARRWCASWPAASASTRPKRR